jgi:DNA repair exonuclease SbcCD ATPase subunit
LAVINEFLPLFEEKVNENLEKLKVNMRVDFNTHKKKSKVTKKDKEQGTVFKEEFNVKVLMENGDESPLNMMSQGERGRVGMCTGFGLRTMTTEQGNNIFDFVFIDEIADSLDATGLSELVNLLDSINGQKFVISHNEELKNYFDTCITAVRTDGVSVLQYS